MLPKAHTHVKKRFWKNFAKGKACQNEFLKFIFEITLYMFQTDPMSIIGSFSLHTQQWYMSYRCADSCQQTCMTYSVHAQFLKAFYEMGWNQL